MKWQTEQIHFVNALKSIYPTSEAENIFLIAIEYITGKDLRANLNHRFILTDTQQKQLKSIVSRLLNHEPIQYITNECWFYDIPFYVDENVLIPRPETEELVHWIVNENKTDERLSILDVGTGSGCIPVILKRKLTGATVYACDVSTTALEVAKKNAEEHNILINFLQLDFLDDKAWSSLPRVDIIVSNPPYIPLKDKKEMRENVLQYEPHVALFVKNESPLVFYKAIANCGKKILTENGRIYVEIHESLGPEVIKLFEQMGYAAALKKDMQGKDRMVKAMLKKE